MSFYDKYVKYKKKYLELVGGSVSAREYEHNVVDKGYDYILLISYLMYEKFNDIGDYSFIIEWDDKPRKYITTSVRDAAIKIDNDYKQKVNIKARNPDSKSIEDYKFFFNVNYPLHSVTLYKDNGPNIIFSKNKIKFNVKTPYILVGHINNYFRTHNHTNIDIKNMMPEPEFNSSS
jgi:hypothetical protein